MASSQDYNVQRNHVLVHQDHTGRPLPQIQDLQASTVPTRSSLGVFFARSVGQKKGFYQNEPDVLTQCSVCGVLPENDDAITDDNWETCSGRNMFFCPEHRVQHPCHNPDCQADLCFSFHEDSDWKSGIGEWDYDREGYD